MKEAGIQINELNSGCICCSLVGDFAKALKQVKDEYNRDRILIEPSGVGKLSDIVKAVERANLEDCKINSLTTVVDANRCKIYMKNFGEFFNDQIENAACIVLSHTDVTAADKLEKAVELVREHNPNATFVTTDLNGLTGEQILSAMEHSSTLADELAKLTEETEEHEHCHHHDHDEEEHEHHHNHHHHADEVFTSWGVETTKTFTEKLLRLRLATLIDSTRYGMVLRAKGIVAGQNGEWLHFDYVPGEINIRVGSAEPIGRLCVIGSKLDEEELKELFGV